MRAVHFLRSRQEASELNYWLALVAYNRQDTSLNNRIYLVYLILFFIVWIFITLTFFASGGAAVLRLIDAANPVRGAAFLQLLMLSLWFLLGIFQAVRRSPVEFSEQDAVLVCQTPIDRRHIVLRWLWMPWLKSAAPFLLAAVVLGFSCAELLLPAGSFAERIVEYSGYGLRAVLAVIPVHLGLFALQWFVGILRLQRDRLPRPYGLIVFPAALVLALAVIASPAAPVGPLAAAVRAITFPIMAGFGEGSLPTALLVSGLIAVAPLLALYRASEGFNLSRAAQETQEVVARNTALQYGFTGLAQAMQARKRLGVQRKSTRLRAFPGTGALIWKDLVQSSRGIRFQSVFDWLVLFALMFGLPFLPDPTSRAFALAYWVIQVAKLSVVRLRGDLANWSLIRQLPIAHEKFLLFDQVLPYLLAVALSLAGLLAYALLSGTPTGFMPALVPGLAAGAAGIAALSVIRGARGSLLLNGTVPEVGAGSILISLLLALIPFLIAGNIPGGMGATLSILASLIYGGTALLLAARSYSRIPA